MIVLAYIGVYLAIGSAGLGVLLALNVAGERVGEGRIDNWKLFAIAVLWPFAGVAGLTAWVSTKSINRDPEYIAKRLKHDDATEKK